MELMLARVTGDFVIARAVGGDGWRILAIFNTEVHVQNLAKTKGTIVLFFSAKKFDTITIIIW